MDEIYLKNEIFGFSSPFRGMGVGSSMRSGGTRFSSSMFGGDDIFSSFGEGTPTDSATRKAPPIEQTLPFRLEELYKGTTKRMKISGEIADASWYLLLIKDAFKLKLTFFIGCLLANLLWVLFIYWISNCNRSS